MSLRIVRFSIITPSYNQLDWLRLCVRSVADQTTQPTRRKEGDGRNATSIEVEHIIQDGGTKGLECENVEKWKCENLPTFSPSHLSTYSLQIFSEPDSGMYDAINQGLKKATGDICAYLNCDEQYLPGALAAVADFFSSHPGVDVVFTDAVVVDENGSYLCSRLAQTPFRDQLWFRMPVLSCATFIRRCTLEKHSLFIDASKKITGDVFWVMAMQKAGLTMKAARIFTSIFTETSNNLGLGEASDQEFLEIRRTRPFHLKLLLPAYVVFHRLRSLFAGVYFQKPFRYALYTKNEPDGRVSHMVENPTQIWKSRLNFDRDAIRKDKLKRKDQTAG